MDPLRSCRLYLGTTIGATPRRCALCGRHLRTHIQVIGPTGRGKTYLLAHLCLEILRHTPCNLIVLDPKGDLYSLLYCHLVARGSGRGVLLWDMQEREFFTGFDPLKPNGLEPATQAKAVREAILAAWGQEDFQHTAQLVRWLYTACAAAVYQDLGFAGALELLRNCSPLRQKILSRLRDPYVRNELAELENYTPAQRESITASSLARLGSFVSDPRIARMLSERAHTLNFDDVLFSPHRSILLVNLARGRPLRRDDVRLLGRMLVNVLLAQRLNRDPDPGLRPTVLVIDELGEMITPELVTACDWGRAFNFWLILGHQYLSQLRREGEELEQAVRNDTLTKIVFGSCSVLDLEQLAPELSLEEFDPYTVKDELDHLELDPIEERRLSTTFGVSRSESDTHGTSHSVTREMSQSYGVARAEGQTRSKGVASSRSRTNGLSESEGATVTDTDAVAQSAGITRSHGHVSTHGTVSGTSVAEISSFAFPEDAALGDGTCSSTTVFGSTTGFIESESNIEAEAHSQSATFSRSRSRGASRSQAANRSQTVGRSEETGESSSQSTTTQRSTQAGHAVSDGTTTQRSTQRGVSTAVQDAPFMTYNKRRVPSSRTFQTREEFLTTQVIRLRKQPVAHFAIKVPGKPLKFLRAPTLRHPWLSRQMRERARQRIYSQPYYRKLLAEDLAIGDVKTTIKDNGDAYKVKNTVRRTRHAKKS